MMIVQIIGVDGPGRQIHGIVTAAIGRQQAVVVIGFILVVELIPLSTLVVYLIDLTADQVIVIPDMFKPITSRDQLLFAVDQRGIFLNQLRNIPVDVVGIICTGEAVLRGIAAQRKKGCSRHPLAEIVLQQAQ